MLGDLLCSSGQRVRSQARERVWLERTLSEIPAPVHDPQFPERQAKPLLSAASVPPELEILQWCQASDRQACGSNSEALGSRRSQCADLYFGGIAVLSGVIFSLYSAIRLRRIPSPNFASPPLHDTPVSLIAQAYMHGSAPMVSGGSVTTTPFWPTPLSGASATPPPA